MSKLLRDRYEKVVVIYDTSIGHHLTSVVSTLESKLKSALGISTLFVENGTVVKVIQSSGLNLPSAYANDMLHVVWTSTDLAIDVLDEERKGFLFD